MADLSLNSDPPPGILPARKLQRLFDLLRAHGYTLRGPLVRDGAVIYDAIETTDQLPAGWTDVQEGGSYRLDHNGGAWFGYTVGAGAWKRFLFPPERRLWSAGRTEEGRFEFHEENDEPPRQAFIGVRACELAAIAVQDRVFMEGPYVDPGYRARREKTFIVAVNCGRSASTCFCTSMGTGPQAARGFDLALTELIDGDRHAFLVQAGSLAGELLLIELAPGSASEADIEHAAAVIQATAASISRSLETDGLREILINSPEHPAWEEVGRRCLSCANCTLACPTCFCSTVEDRTDLTGQTAERWQKWDSCFTLDFSYIHGGSVRSSVGARYRQWMTHKLATWVDQFGTLGCVGCGRCITWCPVGIDIVEMAGQIRAGAEVPAGGGTPDNNGGTP